MSQRLIRFILVSGFLTAAGAAPLFAHALGVSYSHFFVQGTTIGATIRLPMDDMDLLFQLDADLDGKVSLGEIAAARPLIERYLVEKIHILADGEKPTVSLGEMKPWIDRDGTLYAETSLSYQAAREIREIYIQVKVLTDLYNTHKNYAQIQFPDRSQDFVFVNNNAYTTTVPGSFLIIARAFLVLGIKHTFRVYYPVMLFLFALLLVGNGIRDLIQILASFIIGSNITLVLAIMGAIQPVSSRIEEGIALSIAYIAFENLLIKDVQHRWKITFVFGLIYGFGFANILREMHLPRSGIVIGLFGFSVGLAIGQIAIASMVAPIFNYLDKTRWRALVTWIASLIIMGFSLVRFYQRVLEQVVL